MRYARYVLILITASLLMSCGDMNVSKGTRFLEIKDYENAIKFYKQAIEKNPKNKSARIGLANAHFRMAEEDKTGGARELLLKALSNLEIANNINPEKRDYEIIQKMRDTCYTLGLLYKEAKDYEQAIEYLEKSIKIDSGFSKGYSELGNVFSKQERYTKAIEYNNKAIEVNPEYSEAYVNLGDIYKKRNEYDKAEEVLRKVLSINPLHRDAYFSLWSILQEEGKFKEAQELFEKYRKSIEGR